MNKKILILTMSCNKTYFQALLGAVRDTWAKPLIQNKYPDVVWFSYTACDKKHPRPMVDFENHMIYVDIDDDTLSGSYLKTKKAYEMVRDIVDFDYVVRTNTSVFLNINKLIERVNKFPNKIMGNYSPIFEGNMLCFHYIVGFTYGMPKIWFDKAISTDFFQIEHDGHIEVNDDVIMGYNLGSIICIDNCIGVNDDDKTPMYKSIDMDDFDSLDIVIKRSNFNFTFDPEVINHNVMCRVRTLYPDEVRIERGHEIEHLYELNDAYEG